MTFPEKTFISGDTKGQAPYQRDKEHAKSGKYNNCMEVKVKKSGM